MDFIFQTGEFYNTGSSWGTFFSAVLPGLIAILIFVIGIKIEREKKIKAENQRLNQVKSLIETYIKRFNKIKDSQFELLNSFIRELNNDHDNNMELHIKTSYSLQEILEIDKMDILKVIKREYRSNFDEQFITFITQTNYIVSVNKLHFLRYSHSNSYHLHQ